MYDNLGLDWLDYFGKACDPVFASNAEAKSGSRPDDAYWWDLRRNLRASDVIMNRVSALESERAVDRKVPMVVCKLRRDIKKTEDPGYKTESERQRELWAFRTDFDCFDDVEVHALAAHGYAAARKEWREKTPNPKWESNEATAPVQAAVQDAPALPMPSAADQLGRQGKRPNQEVWSPVPRKRGSDVLAEWADKSMSAHGTLLSRMAKPLCLLWGRQDLKDSARVHPRLVVADWQNACSLLLIALSIGLCVGFWSLLTAEGQHKKLSIQITPIDGPQDAFLTTNDCLVPAYFVWLSDAGLAPSFRIVKIIADPGDPSKAYSGGSRRYKLTTHGPNFRFAGYAFCLRGGAEKPLCDAYLPFTSGKDGGFIFDVPPDKIGRSMVVVGKLTNVQGDIIPVDLDFKSIFTLQEMN